MLTIPSDMCAVFDNFVKRWWLYYISTDGQIKLIKGPEEGQLESKDLSTNPPYEPDSIDVSSLNLPAPNGGNSQLGVAEYLDNNGNPQTRVYYLDADNNICELCWNNEKEWFRGALTTLEYEAMPNSVITCAVTNEQLKVYYRGKDKGDQSRLFVAFTAKNEETWSRRPIMSF